MPIGQILPLQCASFARDSGRTRSAISLTPGVDGSIFSNAANFGPFTPCA